MQDEKGNKKIYLIGMMGSGKSYWAGKLGHYYGLPAYDLDRLLENAAGKTIKAIFTEHSEAVFRRMESEMLQHGVVGAKFVLACGGGTPCFFDNMKFMKKNGIVVWLNPSTTELVKRLQRGIESRPVLEGHHSPEALTQHLEQLMAKRKEWYQQAHVIIGDDTNMHTIVQKVEQFRTSQPGF